MPKKKRKREEKDKQKGAFSKKCHSCLEEVSCPKLSISFRFGHLLERSGVPVKFLFIFGRGAIEK